MTGLKPWISLEFICFWMVTVSQAKVMPPPWANPKLNPCAEEPNGWQLLFWPSDGKCYKIFQLGHPCPDGMELSPVTAQSGKLTAECRCPPRTAQYAKDGRCFELFTLGPCQSGFYFGPDHEYKVNGTSKRQWGTCKPLAKCPDSNSIYWPKDNKCHQRLTKGPCHRGLLLTENKNKVPVCTCNNDNEMSNYYIKEGHCYQHFTKGPCRETGELFLPDKTCGCHDFLPHFYQNTEKCYELGTIGPCSKGEMFTVIPNTSTGGCVCKPNYIRFNNSSTCYRPYTQGPCRSGEILINATTCVQQPCQRGELFYPLENKCYKIGYKGPCPKGSIISFDFNTRPSVDGVSYNGVCMCERKDCSENKENALQCDKSKNLIAYQNKCYKLYSQGPCAKGAWLAPKRQGRDGRELLEVRDQRIGVCECIPGHVRKVRMILGGHITECLSPASVLADFLNRNFTITQQ